MIFQYLADGIILGSSLALGAVGLTLTYNILNFANFAHGSLLTWGAYLAWVMVASLAELHSEFPALGFGWPFLLALGVAAILTSVLALIVDWLVFRILRKSNIQVALVIASFGAALMLRNLVVLIFGPEPQYYTNNIQIAREIFPGVRVTPDEIFVVCLAIALVVALHLFLTRTKLGKAMRATADNMALAQVTGIDIFSVIRWTWVVGASLAAIAGIFFGLTVQILPQMGFNLLLYLFAAAILGGIGSIYGAILGGLVIGIASDISVIWISPAYKPVVAFAIMFIVLLIRPNGILGEKS